MLSDTVMLREKRQSTPPLGVSLLLQQLPPPLAVTSTSWPEVMRTLCWLLPSVIGGACCAPGEVEAALHALEKSDHSALAPGHKLTLLRALVSAYLDLGEAGRANELKPVVKILEDHVDRHREIAKERKDAEAKVKRDLLEVVARVDAQMKRTIAEANYTVSSEALAEQMARQADAAQAMGHGGRKGHHAAAAAAAAAAPPPTVPYANAPMEEYYASDGGEGEAVALEAAAAAASEGREAPLSEFQQLRLQTSRRRRQRQEATEVLLAALESRQPKELKDAIALGTECHEGETTDGKPWRAEELRAAIKVHRWLCAPPPLLGGSTPPRMALRTALLLFHLPIPRCTPRPLRTKNARSSPTRRPRSCCRC